MSLVAYKPSVIGLKGIFAKVSLAFSAPKLLLERGSAELGRVKKAIELYYVEAENDRLHIFHSANTD